MSTENNAVVLCIALNPAIDLTIEVPHLVPGEVNRAERAQQDAGGKAINVASCLADHAVKVAVSGQLGRNNPALFEALFKAKGIDNHCLYIDGNTRLNTKLVDPAQGMTTDINLPGPLQTAADIEAQRIRLTEILERLLPTLHWVVLSGSLPPGWPTDTYATLIRQIHAQGVKVLLDTSGAALREALEARPEIIKPNREELAECLGCKLDSPASIVNAARRLLAAHPGMTLVVVSMGHEGALFVTPEQVITALPLPIEPISSVGAGDAMVAGVIAAQLAAFPLPQSAQLATAFAAGKLTRLGAHLPARDVVQRLAEQVRLKTENHF